ncbi:MAG: hypothetical protein J6Z36_04000, partial [Clostridia bacterium]|nr:hypothetical protein [Clostridia bacterium]
MTENRVKNILILLFKILLTLAAAGFGIYLLWRYEYLSQFTQIDNVIGMLPVALVLLFIGGVSAILWVKPLWRNKVSAVILAVFTGLFIALFPNATVGNWWIQPSGMNTQGESPDISIYEPFKVDNQTAKLGEEVTVTITDDFPVTDGALALYPVYAAVAESLYIDCEAARKSVTFTNTLRAYDGIISGERDVIFVAGPSKEQMEAAERAGVKLTFTPIGKEA